MPSKKNKSLNINYTDKRQIKLSEDTIITILKAALSEKTGLDMSNYEVSIYNSYDEWYSLGSMKFTNEEHIEDNQ